MTSSKIRPPTGGRKSWRDVLPIHPALLDGISRLDAMEANGINLVDHCGKFDRTLGYPGFRVRPPT